MYARPATLSWLSASVMTAPPCECAVSRCASRSGAWPGARCRWWRKPASSTDVELLPADPPGWDAKVAEAVLERLHHRRRAAHVDPHLRAARAAVQGLGRGEEAVLLGDDEVWGAG